MEQLKDRYKVAFALLLIIGAAGACAIFRLNLGVVIGATTGILGHSWISAKAWMPIDSRRIPYAKSWLASKKYVLDQEIHAFVPDCARLLRYDSQNVKLVRSDESQAIMYGPHYLLKLFARSANT